jgi:hypothetical protein
MWGVYLPLGFKELNYLQKLVENCFIYGIFLIFLCDFLKRFSLNIKRVTSKCAQNTCSVSKVSITVVRCLTTVEIYRQTFVKAAVSDATKISPAFLVTSCTNTHTHTHTHRHRDIGSSI